MLFRGFSAFSFVFSKWKAAQLGLLTQFKNISFHCLKEFLGCFHDTFWVIIHLYCVLQFWGCRVSFRPSWSFYFISAGLHIQYRQKQTRIYLKKILTTCCSPPCCLWASSAAQLHLPFLRLQGRKMHWYSAFGFMNFPFYSSDKDQRPISPPSKTSTLCYLQKTLMWITFSMEGLDLQYF